jgi:hypothetical protein
VLDRSQAGIERTRAACHAEIEAGLLSTLCASADDFKLPANTELFDIAFACRVGALDGRHPQLYARSISNLALAVVQGGKLYVDTGTPSQRYRCEGVGTGRRGWANVGTVPVAVDAAGKNMEMAIIHSRSLFIPLRS